VGDAVTAPRVTDEMVEVAEAVHLRSLSTAWGPHTAMRAALEAALPLSMPEAEPVAWRWKPMGYEGDTWSVGTHYPRPGWTVEPLYAAPPSPTLPLVGEDAVAAQRYRHKKRGEHADLVAIGKMQAEKWHDLTGFQFTHFGPTEANPVLMRDGNPPTVDMREVAIYRSVDDGSWWVRPREEFEDGRFEVLAPKPAETTECPRCHGHGQLRVGMGAEQTEECSDCGGTGQRSRP
jgi:hypothetical protein